jgi:hypothetical protein
VRRSVNRSRCWETYWGHHAMSRWHGQHTPQWRILITCHGRSMHVAIGMIRWNAAFALGFYFARNIEDGNVQVIEEKDHRA